MLEQAAIKSRRQDKQSASSVARERVRLKQMLVKCLDRIVLENAPAQIEVLQQRYAAATINQSAISLILNQIQTPDTINPFDFIEACETLLQQLSADQNHRLCSNQTIEQLKAAKKQLVAINREKQYSHLTDCKQHFANLVKQVNQSKKYWK